jgi:hypothetical protein
MRGRENIHFLTFLAFEVIKKVIVHLTVVAMIGREADEDEDQL